MRQWELIGITDQAGLAPTRPRTRRINDPVRVATPGRPVFFWSTDTALRLRSVTPAATQAIGLPYSECEGMDLLSIFGMEGPNLAILEAHIVALGGDATEFTLHGKHATVRCRVAPTHDALDNVTGTFCLAVEVQDVDLRDMPVGAAAA
jgi:hypothetical protein